MKLPLLAACTFASLATAQADVLYYKFEGGGAKALNYAPGSPAPGEGPITNTLTSAPNTSFVPGRFGAALNSGIATTPYQGNHVDTGWAPSVTGDYSWAAWLRNSRGAAGPSLTYVAGIPVSGAFRIYSGSSILLTVGNAGGTTYYSTVANVFSMATAGWVHVAFVVDTAAMTATYYLNGVPEAPRVLTALPNIQGATFWVGRQTASNAPSVYDLDEFRFLQRAVTPAEIGLWASMHPAGDSAFGAGCGASMHSSNGLPQLGNFGYGIGVAAPTPNGLGIVALGFSRTNAGALPLPLDLGTLLSGMSGCQWECSAEVTSLVLLDAAGHATLPFPLPPLAAYDQMAFYSQGLLLGGPLGQMTTNPLAIVVGN
jgi:hypothetical protein